MLEQLLQTGGRLIKVGNVEQDTGLVAMEHDAHHLVGAMDCVAGEKKIKREQRVKEKGEKTGVDNEVVNKKEV